MKLVLIFGDSAVGKMTVGQELCKITDLRLFHNHMTVEPVLEVFGDFDIETIVMLRETIFRQFVKSDNYGLVHTFMWSFDHQEDWDYAASIAGLFEEAGGEVYYVELDAPQSVRLARNRTENRLAHKASKRDIEASDRRLLDDPNRYESREGELPFENFLRIRNENVSAEEAARMIKQRFGL